MSISIEEYNLLKESFCGDEDLISSVSTGDSSVLQQKLLNTLNGTTQGVFDLEEKTQICLKIVKNKKDFSPIVRKTIQDAIIKAFSQISLGMLK